jgi:KipI family sensor histidine kinase inhibitor
MNHGRVTFLGDSCLSIAFDEQIDPAINDRCVALAAALERQQRPGVRDVVPGFHSVAIHFDSLTVDRAALAGDVERTASEPFMVSGETASPLEIPVHYGDGDGPDLPAVAAFAGCSEAEVVRLHTASIYRVYMLGFLPGFAYLGSVDRRIAMPRLDTPRPKVAAGSVAIAGMQTGIYPCESPGGWRIIGRTSLKAFDLSRPNPSLFRAGQRVTFVAA